MSAHVEQRLRVGAYGIFLRGESILLTRLSQRTSRPGVWTLPGGGLDHGEAPQDAVVREMYEETGLRVAVTELLTVDSARRSGTDSDGTVVDQHAIRIIYSISSTDQSVPRVLDVGGSSDAAEWVPLAQLAQRESVDMVRIGLEAMSRFTPAGG